MFQKRGKEERGYIPQQALNNYAINFQGSEQKVYKWKSDFLWKASQVSSGLQYPKGD